MATTTGSIGHAGELNTPEVQQGCAVSRGMLVSAFSENAAVSLAVVVKAVLGAAAAWLVSMVLPVAPLTVFAALTATVPVIYLANLADVRNVRDAITSVVPALMVWSILFYDVRSATLVGLTLFTHVMVAFFAGFNRVSGSLGDLRLWPVLFGFMVVTLVFFVDQFLM